MKEWDAMRSATLEDWWGLVADSVDKKVLEPVEQKNPITIRESTEATDSKIRCLQIILLAVVLGFQKYGPGF